MPTNDIYAYDNTIRRANETIATFTHHWAAVAAMIRLTNPDFRSLGTDTPENLAEEARLHAHLKIDKPI